MRRVSQTASLRLVEGHHEQVVGPGVPRVRLVHRGRGNARHADGARFPAYGARHGMRLVGLLVARRRGFEIHEDAAVLHPHVVAGDAILLETGFTRPLDPVKLPVVPRANDEIAVEPALAERAPRMVADARKRPELAIFVGDGEDQPVDRHLRDGPGSEVF